MLYLIGVNHVVQFGAASRASNSKIVREKRQSFKAHVLEVIEKLNITILVEEFSQEAKKKWDVSETALEHFGKTKRIDHRFCTPGREELWLSEIADCKKKSVLFVCGSDHLESFCKKLTAVGFDVELAPKSWSINDAEFFFNDP
jgi:hypothetical protein